MHFYNTLGKGLKTFEHRFITLHASVRGKVIGFVHLLLLSVSMKIARLLSG